MRMRFVGLVAVGAAGLLGLTACGGSEQLLELGRRRCGAASSPRRRRKGKVGVILPDSASSARWETADRPLLKQAFDAAGVESDIQNAGGDVNKFQSIADGMISEGVKALLIVNLDSDSGAAGHQEGQRRRHPRHRLRPADPGRRRDVLRLLRQREGRHGDRRGPGQGPQGGRQDQRPDRPAQRLADRQQRHAVQAGLREGHQGRRLQASPPTRPSRTGTTSRRCTDFEQIYTKTKGNFVGVAAANDGLGGVGRRRADEEQGRRQDPGHRPGRHGRGPAARAARHPVRHGLQGHQEGGRPRPPTSPSRSSRATRPAPTRSPPARSPTPSSARTSRPCCWTRSPSTRTV